MECARDNRAVSRWHPLWVELLRRQKSHGATTERIICTFDLRGTQRKLPSRHRKHPIAAYIANVRLSVLLSCSVSSGTRIGNVQAYHSCQIASLQISREKQKERGRRDRCVRATSVSCLPCLLPRRTNSCSTDHRALLSGRLRALDCRPDLLWGL